VVVTTFVQASGKTAKSIQVELPLETRHLGLLEVLGHDVVNELFRLVNNETAAMRLPRNDVSVAITLDCVKHGVQLDREWNYYAAFRLVLDLSGIHDGIGRVVVVVVSNDYLAFDAVSTAVFMVDRRLSLHGTRCCFGGRQRMEVGILASVDGREERVGRLFGWSLQQVSWEQRNLEAASSGGAGNAHGSGVRLNNDIDLKWVFCTSK